MGYWLSKKGTRSTFLGVQVQGSYLLVSRECKRKRKTSRQEAMECRYYSWGLCRGYDRDPLNPEP